MLQKHVLKHKNGRKNLVGKKKWPNFALAFEDEALQRRRGREGEKKEGRAEPES
ncbi:MAG: hypothetical protein K2J10_01265 [Muribaculaceae bacterium]|nr:hypothetical protein [Muribaculaceae bacterium]